jgi:hypothetical protein
MIVSRKNQIWHRFGSAIIALILPAVVLVADAAFPRILRGDRYEIDRALTSVVCMGLLAHSWLRQRRYCRNAWEFGFCTAVLALPLLEALWLGLNVIRANLYPLNWTDAEANRFYLVCEAQVWTQRVAAVTGILAAVLGLTTLISERQRSSPTHS